MNLVGEPVDLATAYLLDWISQGALRAVGVADTYVVKREMQVLRIKRTTEWLTPAGQELKHRIDAFENYLEDFSLLNEKDASYALIWDRYMVWAGLLGIAEEVAAHFTLVDPTWTEASAIPPRAITTVTAFSSSTSSALSGASGSGGSASFGGGGGSFGGGVGGGIR